MNIEYQLYIEYRKTHTNNLLGEYQFGFRRNKSTVSEMLTLYETLQEAKEQGLHSLVILFDLSAAFDTVEPRFF